MKKIKVNMNDRIVCDYIDRNTLQYWYEEAHTGQRYPLGEPFAFSLSVKNYFGGLGKTFRQLSAFKEWHNKRLTTELKRIRRAMEARSRQREVVCKARFVLDDERAA